MGRRLIAAVMTVLVLAGPAVAQGRGEGRDFGRDAPRVEEGSGGDRPDAGRRDRTRERVPEGRERRRGGEDADRPRDEDAGRRSRGGGRDIYRGSSNYRRW